MEYRAVVGHPTTISEDRNMNMLENMAKHLVLDPVSLMVFDLRRKHKQQDRDNPFIVWYLQNTRRQGIAKPTITGGLRK